MRPDAGIDADVERLDEALEAVQGRHGLVFVYDHDDEQDGVKTVVWREMDDRAVIKLIDDQTIASRFVQVEGEGGSAAMVVEVLGEHIPFFSLAELRDAARKRMSDDPSSLIRLALATGDPVDDESRAVVAKGLESADPEVRQAAVMAAALIRSPDLIAKLELLRDEADDDSLRAYVEQAIRDCEAGR